MLDLTRAYGLDFLFPARDKIVGPALRDAGEFAKPEMEILNRLVRAAGRCTYLDIGANIGSIALPIASRNPGVQVIALEANRHLAMILSANALMNRLDNVDVHHAAAGSAQGLAHFPSPPLTAAINFGDLGMKAKAGEPMEPVRMCALDELAPPNTRVIKVDVQGFEPEVLAGAGRLIRARKASWVIEHNGDEKSIGVTERFLSEGYKIFWLFAPFVTRTASKGEKQKGEISGDTNILAIPEGDPPVPMTKLLAADEKRPGGPEGYPYLKAFGY